MYLFQQSTDGSSLDRQARNFAEEAAELRTQSEAVIQELDGQLDPHYSKDNLPSARARLILEDLRGEGTSYYLDNLYGKSLTLGQRHDVGRAMVLAGSDRSGLKDRIARDLTEQAIRRSIVSHGQGGYSLGFELDSRTRTTGSFGWSDYMDRVSGKVAGSELSISRKGHTERMLQINCGGGERLRLTLRDYLDQDRFSWHARGSSKTISRHRKLVKELNLIAADYLLRTFLRDQYGNAKFYPGLTAVERTEMERLLEKVNYSQSLPNVLPNLRPGAYFGDEPSVQERRTTRIYMLRCEECLQPAAFDVVYPVGATKTKNWASTNQELIGHRIVEETYFNLELEKFHRAKGCSSVLAYNHRTGSVQDLREHSGRAIV